MKKCLNCGKENSNEMNFCGECGAKLQASPQMVVPLEEIEGNLTESKKVTDSFNVQRETETAVGNRQYIQPSVPTLSANIPPQSSKKIFIVFGVLAFLFLLISVAAGTMFYLYQRMQKIVAVKPTPIPTRINPKQLPSPTPSATPEPSPSEIPKETPEPTPEETPKETPEVTFTPPEKPTQQGAFTIGADDEDWQLSEIETVPSESFQTTIRGTIVLGDIKANVLPGGVKGNKERRIYKKYPTGALLMRTRYADGKVSNIQPITASKVWQNFPNERGRLEFIINDNEPENNEGRFIVSVKMISVPK